MARKKKSRAPSRRRNSLRARRPKLPSFTVPEGVRHLVFAVSLLVIAAIYIFSFFEKAGSAGALLFGGTDFLFGQVVYLLPFVLGLGGFVLLRQEEGSVPLVAVAMGAVLLGTSGMAGAFADVRGLDIRESAGFLGFLFSRPLMAAFGFWVSEVILVAVVFVGLGILWRFLPREREGEEPSFGEVAQEKIKKIFEPKFEIKEVEPTVRSPAAEQEEKKEEKEEKHHQGLVTLPAGSAKLPPLNLLEAERGVPSAGDVRSFSAIIKKTLQNFDIPVEVSEVNIGPAVTQYAIKPSEGVKLSKITGLSNDLALALAAHPIRIEAPIPGRALVGIEIPNQERAIVRLRGLLEHPHFKESSTPLNIGLGRDVSGNAVFGDLGRMPHLLVAGATGSGKTIALNNIILSLIYRNTPQTLRFVLIDPKRVEFPVYNELPHLLTPVIFDTQKAIFALRWLVKEMERRFEVLAAARARDIGKYHEILAKQREKDPGEGEDIPYLVVIIDELADLIAARGKEIEALVVRLAQMARAVGIHLVLATQRPSVEVITGLIKANITARVAFQVASQVDSRTILDMAGAEKLLGYGDMLFLSSDFSKPRRIQGAFVSDKDVRKVVEWLNKETETQEREELAVEEMSVRAMESGDSLQEEDPLYEQAKHMVLETRKASASFLQRRLRLGYARAARILDLLEEQGVVGPAVGAKPREVYGEASAPSSIVEEENGESSEWYSPRIGGS
ncbi:MAG: DNA translocase FtsK [Patescibacteria group bacterium]